MKNNIVSDKSSLVMSDERLDDLELDDLMIIQKINGYKFSTDSVLLSDFVKAKPSNFYIDLCSGSGVVAILVAYKNNLKKALAIEIQSQLANMAERSIKYNGLESRIEVLCEDLSLAHKTIKAEVADVISVNPPYNEVGLTSDTQEIMLATHEIKTNLKEICKASSKLLKFGGKLFMVHRADRLVDILCALRENNLEPKVLRVVYPKASKEPNLVLVEAKKGASAGIKVLSPLILMNEDGTETDELKTIYNRKK